MVRPMYRSHSNARIQRRLPGNIVGILFKRFKPHASVCASTGEKLHGVPRLRPAALQKLTKSARRPNRPYGGKFSHKVLANHIWAKLYQESSPEE